MFSLMISKHFREIKNSMVGIDEEIERIYDVLKKAKEDGARIWVLGNGGSLAIAQHFAQDLLKMCSVKAQAYNCPSMITAFSNDDGFEYSYFNPLNKLIGNGDVIFIFSCSGKSRNYIEFVSGFPDNSTHKIISVVGTDGGFLKLKSNICAHIKSHDYQVCETAFCFVADMLVKSLMEGGNSCHE